MKYLYLFLLTLIGAASVVGYGTVIRNNSLDYRADAYCQGSGFQGGKHLKEGAECYNTQTQYAYFALPPAN